MNDNNSGKGGNSSGQKRKILAVVAVVSFIGLCLLGVAITDEGFAGDVKFEDNAFVYEITNKKEGIVSIVDYKGDVESLVIPSEVLYNGTGYKVKTIGVEAFRDCKNMTSVVIPDSVTSAGPYAFMDCKNLTSVTLPIGFQTVVGLGGDTQGRLYTVFTDCDNLTTFTFIPTEQRLYSDEYATGLTPWGCESSKVDTIVISEGVTEIPDYMLHGAKALKNLTLPSTLITIGKGAFEGCKTFEGKLDLSKITSLGSYAFKDCNALKDVVIPTGIDKLNRSVFENCKALKSVTIPGNITSLERSTFKGCKGITELTVPIGVNTVVKNGDPAFEGCTAIEKVVFTGRDGFNYEDSTYTPWKISKSLKTVVLSEGIQSIGKNTFNGLKGDIELVLPGSLASIGAYAFKGFAFFEADGVTFITPIPENLRGRTFAGEPERMVEQ